MLILVGWLWSETERRWVRAAELPLGGESAAWQRRQARRGRIHRLLPPGAEPRRPPPAAARRRYRRRLGLHITTHSTGDGKRQIPAILEGSSVQAAAQIQG